MCAHILRPLSRQSPIPDSFWTHVFYYELLRVFQLQRNTATPSSQMSFFSPDLHAQMTEMSGQTFVLLLTVTCLLDGLSFLMVIASRSCHEKPPMK